MSDWQTVIYTARTAQDAHFLKNLLAEAQITAMVSNELLDGGKGIEAVGWATSARVVVAEDDAPRAREIALEFDRWLAEAASRPAAADDPVEPTGAPPEDWPTCPNCDARRSTRCPICGTAGTDFALADMGFEWVPGPGDPLGAGGRCGDASSGEGQSSCGCGSRGCTSAGDSASESEPDEFSDEFSDEAKPAAVLLMCPICDEPFSPRHARLCEWCGHEFADGDVADLPAALAEPLNEQLNSRVIGVIAVLAFLGIAAAVYFLGLAS